MVFGFFALSWPARPALTRPRSYSAWVIRLNAREPWGVNSTVTIGWPVFASTAATIPDSTRSLPVSDAGDLSRYQALPLFETPFEPEPGQPADSLHWTT